MGIFADLKLMLDFRRFEKQAGREITRNNPLVHIFGHEKTYGKPGTHEFDKFIKDTVSWAFVCAYKNAFSVAAVDLKLYKKVKKEGGQADVEEIQDHVFLDLMRNVNPHFNQFELKALTSMFMDITGNAYWWMVKDNLGIPRAIWNLPANWIKIIPNKNGFVDGYVMTVPGRGDKVPFEADEIVHFKFPSIFDIHYGTPPMYGASYDIDLNKYMKTYGINFFLNNAQPGGVLQTESALTDDQFKRLKLMWKMRHGGVGNAGKMAILEKGLKYQQIGSNMKDLKFGDMNRNIRDGILAAFGVPASKLGLVEDVNRANADANDYTYQKETIKPRLTLIQEKINEKVMPMYGNEPGMLICKFDNPVPKDRDFELKKRTEHIKAGVTSIDEEREEEGLEPYKLPETEVPLIPFNLTPAGSGGEPSHAPGQEPVPGQEPEKAIEKELKSRRRRKWEVFAMLTGPQEKIFATTMRRYFERQGTIIMGNINRFKSKNVKAELSADIIFNLIEENGYLKEVSRPHVEEAYKSGVALGYEELNRTVDFGLLSPTILRAVEERVGFFADKVNEATIQLIEEALQTGIEAGESITGIARRLERITEFNQHTRAVRVARTEVIGGANAGQLQSYRDAGIKSKMWITARDEKVRDSHIIDGQVVELDESFTLNSGVKLQYPGDRTGGAPAGELVNCRCAVSPIVKKE